MSWWDIIKVQQTLDEFGVPKPTVPTVEPKPFSNIEQRARKTQTGESQYPYQQAGPLRTPIKPPTAPISKPQEIEQTSAQPELVAGESLGTLD